MSRTLALTSLLLLGACGRGPDPTQEIEALKRRVTSLERRLSELDNGGKKPTKPGDGGPQADAPKADGEEGGEPSPKSTITVTGEAFEVALMRGKRKLSLPATVPPGEYTIQAVFEEGQPPTAAGSITVTPGSQVTLECKAETKACTPKQ